MSIFTFEDPKALIECSYKIGDSSVSKKPLVEATTKTKSLFEAIGDSEEKEVEEVKYVDAIEKKFKIRGK